MKEVHSNEVKDMLKEGYGREIVDLMEKVVNLNTGDFNTVILISEPYTSQVLASIAFYGGYPINIDEGKPALDIIKLNAMSKRDQLKELNALITTIVAMMSSLDRLHSGLKRTAIAMSDLEEQLEKETNIT